MHYIIMDLEWNQPLGPSLMVREPVRLDGEIIEIGAVKLDESFRTVDTFKTYVRPVYYKKMHRKIGGLTHISPAMLAEAPAFPEALASFLDWCGTDFRFMTWSGSDTPMIRRNMAIHGIDADLGEETIDLQWIFQDQFTKDWRRYNLSQALSMLRLPIETAHDALNDCINTARLADNLELEQGIADFDEWLAECDEDEESA